MKDRLVYVAAEAADSDNVGAVLKDSAGNHVTTSDMGGGIRAIDVNVVSTGADGIFLEDAASADGHAGQSILAVRQDTLATSTSLDGDYSDVKVNARGGLWSVPVGNVDDDAADLEFPVKVGARADSVLSAVSDADRVNMVSDLFRRLRVNESADIGLVNSQDLVDNVAETLMGTAQAGRKKLLVQNLANNRDIYVGATGVSVASGFKIQRGSTWEFAIGPNVAMYAIGVDATTADVRQLELA